MHKVIQGFTKVYKGVQGLTKVDRGFQGITRVYSGLQGFSDTRSVTLTYSLLDSKSRLFYNAMKLPFSFLMLTDVLNSWFS